MVTIASSSFFMVQSYRAANKNSGIYLYTFSGFRKQKFPMRHQQPAVIVCICTKKLL
jgi:hypothetical protein